MKTEKNIAYSISLPEKLKQRLERIARDENRGLRKQTVVLLEQAVDRHTKGKTAKEDLALT